MKSRILFAYALMLMSYMSIAQVPEHLRINARGMGEAGILKARAIGAKVFTATNLRRVGGVLFQGRLKDKEFVQSITDISIEKIDAIGRLLFTFSNNKQAYYDAPYWLIAPIIEYAMSDDNGVVSLFGNPAKDEIMKLSNTASKYLFNMDSFYENINAIRQCVKTKSETTLCKKLYESYNEEESKKQNKKFEIINDKINTELKEYMKYFFFTDVHPALNSSSLGLRMLQADSLLIDISYVEVINIKGQATLFPGEEPVSKEQTNKLGLQIRKTMQQCSEKNKYDARAWILTDVSTKYSAKVLNGRVIIDGVPYYYIWGNDVNGEPIEIINCTLAMKELRGSFSMRAPLTWGAVLHVSRLTALIKTLAVVKPIIAKKLLQYSKKMKPPMVIKISIPRAWPRQGYEDI